MVPPKIWPTQQQVEDLAESLDGYTRDYLAMRKLSKELKAANEWSRKGIIQEAQKVIENFEMSGGRSGVKDERLKKEWEACCPDSWWPKDNEGPVYSEVAKMIAVLMGSFPTSKIPNPEIFVRVLLDDVMALTPSFVEMESTCRHLRQTKKSMPSISEVVETMREQQKLWERRSDTAYSIARHYNNLDRQEQIARAKAKSQPIAVGDRVRDPKLGCGTVTALLLLGDDGGTHYRVHFDASTERDIAGAASLERLVADDEGFEPPAVPMIEHRKDVPMAPIASPTVPLEAKGSQVGVPADRNRDTRNGEDD